MSSLTKTSTVKPTKSAKTSHSLGATSNPTTNPNAAADHLAAVPGTIKTVNFTQTFPSGQVELTNRDALAKQMGELQAFLKGKDASKFRVVIVAGESQVTNQAPYQKPGSLAHIQRYGAHHKSGK